MQSLNSTTNVSVTFHKLTTTKNVCEKIKELNNPQLLFWYFGPGGLGEEGANFYKKHFFCPIAEQIKQKKEAWEPKCWLYDLTGWATLKSKTKNIHAYHPLIDKINGYAIPYIHAIKSSEFFDWLKNTEDQSLSKYVNETVLNRKAIYRCSEEKKASNFTVGEVFNNVPSMIDNLYKVDCQKSYSSFQYVEALYLIQSIVQEQLAVSSKEIEIGFVVPNDEIKYYVNDNHGDDFRTDLNFILQNRFGDSLKKVELRVSFHSFIFGHKDHRPYLSGKKMLTDITPKHFQK